MGAFFVRGTSLIPEGSTLMIHPLPKSPPPKTIPCGAEFSAGHPGLHQRQCRCVLLTQAGTLHDHDCSDTQFLHLQIEDSKSYTIGFLFRAK